MATTKRGMIPVQGIAFDLEGTVINVEPLHYKAHLRAAADVRVNLTLQDALKLLPHFVGGPDEAVAAEIASLAGGSVSASEVLLAKRFYFKKLLGNHDGILPRDGFNDFINWVRTLELRIAIGTTSYRDLAIDLLKRAGLLQTFGDDVVVTRDDVPLPKPSPDIYFETARRLGITPKSQLVFEDSVVGLCAARSAECRLAALPTIKLPEFVQDLHLEGAEAIFMTWCEPGIRPFVLSLISTKPVLHSDPLTNRSACANI